MIKIIISMLCISFCSFTFAHGGIGPMSAWEYFYLIFYLFSQAFFFTLFSIRGVLLLIFSVTLAYYLPQIIRNKDNWLSKRHFLNRFFLVIFLSYLSLFSPLLLILFSISLIIFFISQINWNQDKENLLLKANYKQLLTTSTAIIFVCYIIVDGIYHIQKAENSIVQNDIHIVLPKIEKPKPPQKLPAVKYKKTLKTDIRCRDKTTSDSRIFPSGLDNNACQHFKDIRQINRSEK